MSVASVPANVDVSTDLTDASPGIDSSAIVLMSSHRDYESDKEWMWLRNDGLGLKFLHFVPVADSDDESTYELVVDRRWSTKVGISLCLFAATDV